MISNSALLSYTLDAAKGLAPFEASALDVVNYSVTGNTIYAAYMLQYGNQVFFNKSVDGGATWGTNTGITTSFPYLHSMASDGERIVLTYRGSRSSGEYNIIYSINGGTNWTLAGDTGAGVVGGMWSSIVIGDIFVCVGAADTGFDLDPTTGWAQWRKVGAGAWTKTTNYIGTTGMGSSCLAYGNNVLVCSKGLQSNAASTTPILYSSDVGATWNTCSAFSGNTWVTSITFLDGRFIANSSAGMFVSVNGINWTLKTATSNYAPHPFKIKDLYLEKTANGVCSYDLTTWYATPPFATPRYSINGNVFAVYGGSMYRIL